MWTLLSGWRCGRQSDKTVCEQWSLNRPFFIKHDKPQMEKSNDAFTIVIPFFGLERIQISSDLAFCMEWQKKKEEEGTHSISRSMGKFTTFQRVGTFRSNWALISTNESPNPYCAKHSLFCSAFWIVHCPNHQ